MGLGACSSDSDGSSPVKPIDSGQGISDSKSAADAFEADCTGIVGEGYAVGQIAQNWTSLDGAGNQVQLYDYCGKVIFYENGAEW